MDAGWTDGRTGGWEYYCSDVYFLSAGLLVWSGLSLGLALWRIEIEREREKIHGVAVLSVLSCLFCFVFGVNGNPLFFFSLQIHEMTRRTGGRYELIVN